MEAFAASLEGFALAEWLRYSRWGYASVSAAHLLGISLLVGAVVALDLRLLGLWGRYALAPLYRVLWPVAATGLAIAIVSGVLLFMVRATEYARLELFLVKIGLVATGAVIAAAVHFVLAVESLPRVLQRLVGALSLSIWISVLVCGRMLAFV